VISVLLCLEPQITGVSGQGGADGLVDGTETDCYTVDSAGTATLVSVA